MSTKMIRQFFLLLAFVSPLFSYCQKENQTKILGTWAFTKIEFTKPMDDSMNLINNAKGMIVTFEKENQITVKQKTGDEVKVRGIGEYSVSEDGKSMIQNGVDTQIIMLTGKELATKTVREGFVMYFKKIEDSK